MYIISSCLLGQNCKYNGGNNRCQEVIDFCAEKKYITVCPESAAKLPCPRPPAERIGDKVINDRGKDVTAAFEKGAQLSLGTCTTLAGFPSCGCGKIYDGTFSGTLTDGNGVFTELLINEGIPVITEKDTETIKKWLAAE